MPERSDWRRRWRGALLALAALACAAPARSAENPELRLGAVPLDIPAVMHQRLKPLADYLGQELGRPVHLRLAPDYTQAVNDLADGTVDIAYLAPVAYVRARAAGDARVIARTVTRGRDTFQLVLVTRAGSEIRHPQDLVGRRFAFGDASAYLQRAVLLQAGVDMGRFGSHQFLGSFENIVRGVLSGDFDAGIVKDTTAYQWEDRGLRVFHRSPPLPPYNIAVSRRIDETLARRIAEALLRLRIDDPRHARVLRTLDPSYDGFAPATDRDYDVIRTLLEPLKAEMADPLSAPPGAVRKR